jgi:hypothetical protein
MFPAAPAPAPAPHLASSRGGGGGGGGGRRAGGGPGLLYFYVAPCCLLSTSTFLVPPCVLLYQTEVSNKVLGLPSALFGTLARRSSRSISCTFKAWRSTCLVAFYEHSESRQSHQFQAPLFVDMHTSGAELHPNWLSLCLAFRYYL